MSKILQHELSPNQLAAFYHDEFVADQVSDFTSLVGPIRTGGVVVDIGGGCGFFAHALAIAQNCQTRVVDMDPASIEACARLGVDGRNGDALAPEPVGDEQVVCFNLILHHLVGSSERITRAMQIKALRAWRGRAPVIFVNEYIYQSYVGHLSPRIIYEITSSRILSALASLAARVVPSFKANTFGVGVRFRSHEEWIELFEEAGFRVTKVAIGADEPVAHPLRLLLIRTIRRDSFRLEAK